MADPDRKSVIHEQTRAAYAARPTVADQPPAPGNSSASPQALERTLAVISEEVTQFAIDERSRAEGRLARLMAAVRPSPGAALPATAPEMRAAIAAAHVLFAAADEAKPADPGVLAMTPEATPPVAPGADAADELAKYGITRSRMDVFHYGGYRYTNPQDAIAEAKRHPALGNAAATR